MGLLTLATAQVSFASPTTAYYSCQSKTKSLVIVPVNENKISIANNIESSEWKVIKLKTWFSGTDSEGGACAHFSLSKNVTVGVPMNMLKIKMKKGTVTINTWDNNLVTDFEKYTCNYIPANF